MQIHLALMGISADSGQNINNAMSYKMLSDQIPQKFKLNGDLYWRSGKAEYCLMFSGYLMVLIVRVTYYLTANSRTQNITINDTIGRGCC